MNLTGITNENEFYSDHYLADIFDGDIRGVLEAWNTRETSEREAAQAKGEAPRHYAGYRNPVKRLAGMAREHLQAVQAAERIREPAQRLRALRRLTQQLLDVFDLPYEPEARVLDEADTVIPLLAALHDETGEPLLWIVEALPAVDAEADEDPLSLTIQPEQIETLIAATLPKDITQTDPPDWQKRLSHQVFSRNHPPRWVLPGTRK